MRFYDQELLESLNRRFEIYPINRLGWTTIALYWAHMQGGSSIEIGRYEVGNTKTY
jgi:hypothetical protein